MDSVSDEKGDVVFYTLCRFLELASTANPNIIELLFIPDDCVLTKTSLMDKLLDQRELFITKRAYESHIGYAQAQIKKARGRNKWINNPQPDQPPTKEAFCWFIPRNGTDGFPYRPQWLPETDLDLSECHVSSLEHSENVYRVYHYGADARGVFRGSNIACESIPKEDEGTRCRGLLIYNREAFERAFRDHKHYWEWRSHRNETRWKTQERGESDYDTKNMMHTFRLLISGEHILREGMPLVRFRDENLEFLMKILNAEYSYDYLIQTVEQKIEAMRSLRDQSDLPDKANVQKINELLRELTEAWEAEYATAD
jgi:predicted nucleotidyltransferase